MNFFRIALSLYGVETLFYARVDNGKAEKSQLNDLYCIFTIIPLEELLKHVVIMIKRGKILGAKHDKEHASRLEDADHLLFSALAFWGLCVEIRLEEFIFAKCSF